MLKSFILDIDGFIRFQLQPANNGWLQDSQHVRSIVSFRWLDLAVAVSGAMGSRNE